MPTSNLLSQANSIDKIVVTVGQLASSYYSFLVPES